MALMIEPKKKPPVPGMWWEKEQHPLSDAEFIDAFCRYVFLHTDDRSLVLQRNRCFRFIRNVMTQELEAELSKYRETYP